MNKTLFKSYIIEILNKKEVIKYKLKTELTIDLNNLRNLDVKTGIQLILNFSIIKRILLLKIKEDILDLI